MTFLAWSLAIFFVACTSWFLFKFAIVLVNVHRLLKLKNRRKSPVLARRAARTPQVEQLIHSKSGAVFNIYAEGDSMDPIGGKQ